MIMYTQPQMKLEVVILSGPIIGTFSTTTVQEQKAARRSAIKSSSFPSALTIATKISSTADMGLGNLVESNQIIFMIIDIRSVNLEQRCDGNMDCEDKSDEVDCNQIQLDSAYLSNIPASKIEAGSEDDRLPLEMSVDINSILELDEVKSLMKLQLKLSLIWRDQRLVYYDLKKDDNINTLTMSQKAAIWMPELVFYNTKEMSEALFQNTTSSFVTISRVDGTFSAFI